MTKVPNQKGDGNTKRVPPHTEPPTQNRIAKPDWEKWGALAEVWLPDAVALSCDIAPEDLGLRSLGHPDPLGEFFAPESLRFRSDLPPEFIRRFEIAANHIRAGTLQNFARHAQFSTQGGFVRLAIFARWAEGRGWSLPAEFPLPPRAAAPAPLPEPAAGEARGLESADLTLGTRERKTLLTIIVALAKKQRIKVQHPSSAAQSIEAATEEIGNRVAARTIQGILARARQMGLIPEDE